LVKTVEQFGFRNKVSQYAGFLLLPSVLRTPTTPGHPSAPSHFCCSHVCLCCFPLSSLYDTRRLDCLALRYKSLTGFSVTSDITVQPSGFSGVLTFRSFLDIIVFADSTVIVSSVIPVVARRITEGPDRENQVRQ
jgi:hypothetical protein